jgi:hypothetical protein
MLKYGQDYVDKGMEFYQQRYQKQQINWMQKKAKRFRPRHHPDRSPSRKVSF